MPYSATAAFSRWFLFIIGRSIAIMLPLQLWNGIEALLRKLSWGTVTVIAALILWSNWWSEHAASLDKNVVLMWWNRSFCKLDTHRPCLLYRRGFTFWHHLVQYVTIAISMATLLPWNAFLCDAEQCRDWEVEIDLVTWLTAFKDFTMGLHLGSGPDMQCINSWRNSKYLLRMAIDAFIWTPKHHHHSGLRAR